MAFKPIQKPGEGRKLKFGGFKAAPYDRPLPPTDPLAGTSGPERFMIGMGSGMIDMGQGVAQALGADNLEAIRAKQRIDEIGGLSDSAAATAGNVAGKMALAAPTMFLPGANTAAGAAAIGTGIGLAEPVADDNVAQAKMQNALTGGLLGVGGQQLGRGIGKFAANHLANRGQANLLQQNLNAVKDQTLQQGQKLGYKVNPVQANPSMRNRLLEGYAGKLSTAQQVAEHNQGITNAIARKAVGMADDAPITPEALATIRDKHGQVYKQISSIKQKFQADDQYLKELSDIASGPIELLDDFPDFKSSDAGIPKFIDSLLVDDFNPKSAVEIVKRLRKDSATHFKSMDDPAKRALAFAEKKAANALDSLIGRNLDKIGKGGLHKDWRAAREGIAKTYTVENALNEGAGNVVAHKLARAYSKGDPITGELAEAARFAQTFDRATQEIKSSMPGVSPLDFALGVGGTAASGNPSFMAVVAGRPAVRNLITSNLYQKASTMPKYRGFAGAANMLRGPALPGLLRIGAPAGGPAAIGLIQQEALQQ